MGGDGVEDVGVVAVVEHFDEVLFDGGELGLGGEDDGATAESGSGEARAERSGVERGLGEAIEFGATDFELIAEAAVAFIEDAAEGGGIGGFEGGDGLLDTGGFGNDVEEAAAFEGVC